MLDLVKDESERIDARLLESACGSGNFLVAVLRRKLAAVDARYRANEFERRHYALLGLMCIYGIELLADNVAECRANLLEILAEDGDALTMRTDKDEPITFAEWGYLGKGKYQRRDFRLDTLTMSSAFSEEGSLFASLGKHEVFTPARTWPPLTVSDLARVPTDYIHVEAV
jgi:hypothetical protein